MKFDKDYLTDYVRLAKMTKEAPINAGLYTVQLLSTASTLNSNYYKSNYGIDFDANECINSRICKMDLSEKQARTLLEDSDNFNLYSTDENYIFKDHNMPTSFIIHAKEGWSPSDFSMKYRKLSNSIYIVEGVSTLNLLLKDRHIDSIFKKPKLEFLNRFNAGFLQNGDRVGKLQGDHYEIERTINNLGLTGKKQVVAVVDTGVDEFHPFFYDENIRAAHSANGSFEYNLNHRKIVSIYKGADCVDDEIGHGSHCAGTVLGKANCDNCNYNKYQGVAPDAKLFMIDIGSVETGNLEGDWDLDYVTPLMNKNFDCHITSNSWGSSKPSPLVTFLYDYAAYSHLDTLHVFAAGNQGNEGYFSVHSPGDSKNVLTVGAINMPEAAQRHISNFNKEYFVMDAENNVTVNVTQDIKHMIQNQISDPEWKWENLNVFLQSSEGDPKDKIVLLDNIKFDGKNRTYIDICDATVKYENLGAKAVVYQGNTSTNICKLMKYSFNIPIFFTEEFDKLKNFQNFKFVREFTTNTTLSNNITWFSSIGPTFRGTTKPDVVAPGLFTMSAKSGNHLVEEVRALNESSLEYMSGTSMSTPAMTGVVTLFREFFKNGWYKGLTESSSESIKPSAALMRSTVINSARSILANNTGPNIKEGFGMPNMLNVLPFKDEKLGFRYVDNISIAPDTQHAYKIKISNKDAPLVITLSYTDIYATFITEIFQPLMADLDLIVKSPSGKIYHGNVGRADLSDIINTNERVFIDKDEVEIGVYNIMVEANNYSSEEKKQPFYAITVSGGFDHKDFETNPPILAEGTTDKCVGCQGTCKNNQCICDSVHAGKKCETDLYTIQLAKTHRATLLPNYPVYGKIDVGTYSKTSPPYFTVSSNVQMFLAVSDKPIKSIYDSTHSFYALTDSFSYIPALPLFRYSKVVYFAMYSISPVGDVISFRVQGIQPDTSMISKKLATLLVFGVSFLFVGITCIVAWFILRRYIKKFFTDNEANQNNQGMREALNP